MSSFSSPSPPVTYRGYLDEHYQLQRGWTLNPQRARNEADSGDVNAQIFLGCEALKKGSSDAVYWFEKAAAQGHPQAIQNLAAFYEQGIGGAKQDLVKTCEWMEKYLNSDSTERNPDLIRKFLYAYGACLLGCRFIEQELPVEKQNAQKGCELLERAGNDFNCMDSIKLLGAGLYMTGLHPQIPKNIEKAMYWMLKGAQNGDGESADQLAQVFSRGFVPVNRELEVKWRQVAEKLGYAVSMAETPVVSRSEAQKLLKNIKKEKGIEALLMTDSTKKCSNPECNKEEGEQRFSVCNNCCHVKYCGKACQASHWNTGHKKVCPKLQQVKEELKEFNRNTAIAAAGVCFNPDCQEIENHGVTFKRCASCKTAIYCSRDCQVAHYMNGHKKVCKQVLNYIKEADKLLGNLELDKGSAPTSQSTVAHSSS